MKINEIMTKEVEVIRPDTSLKDAAKKMKELNVGVLPVGNDRTLEGILTDRDITIRAAAEGKDPASTLVRDVMTNEVVCCKEDSDIEEAAKIMQQKQIRRLPIVDGNNHICGIVSLGDIAVDQSNKMSGEILQKVSEPSHPTK